MKKVLVLAGQKSYPATDGGKISILYSLLEFAKHFEVYHCFISEKPLTPSEEDFFRANNIRCYPIIKDTKDSRLNLLKNVFEQVPFKMKKYWSEQMFSTSVELINEHKIDFVWIVQAHLGKYGLSIKQKFDIPIFLREQNVESELVRQFGIYGKNKLFKLIGKWQYLKTKKHEHELWNKLDKTYFISDLDYRQAINFIKTPEKAVVLYDSFAGKKITDQPIKEEKSLLFSGSLKTFQNVINLEDFLDEIMLNLLKKDRSWKLYITANNKLNLKKEFKIDQVINAGFVEDIDRYTIQKKYFISPTIMGSGVRIKILNAMALGMVCFISKLDYESMDYFVDMENVVQYSDFEEFYQKLMHLESTPADYDKISDNALKVHQDLTWHKYMNNVLASIGA